MPTFVFLSIGLHEEVDRRVSQNSLGDMTKLGSKTALNRRVRKIFILNRVTGKTFFFLFCFFFFDIFNNINLEHLSNHSYEIFISDPRRKSPFLNQ